MEYERIISTYLRRVCRNPEKLKEKIFPKFQKIIDEELEGLVRERKKYIKDLAPEESAKSFNTSEVTEEASELEKVRAAEVGIARIQAVEAALQNKMGDAVAELAAKYLLLFDKRMREMLQAEIQSICTREFPTEDGIEEVINVSLNSEGGKKCL